MAIYTYVYVWYMYICICTYAQQGTYYTSSLKISFDRDTFIFSWKWLMKGILFYLPVCIFCLRVSDTFVLMSNFSSLHQTSFVFSCNFFSSWLNNVTVWCLVYLTWLWVQHLWASDALPSRKEFPWLARVVGALHEKQASAPLWVLWQYGSRSDSLLSRNEHCSESGILCI